MLNTSIITWETIPQFGDLWWQQLKIRKSLFVDEEGWNIPHTDKVEWDQYDTPRTIYVVTHENGIVRSASRLNPCIQVGPNFSYMIKDACEGKLKGIPSSILSTPPVDDRIWEATRFTVDPRLPNEVRNAYLVENAKALADYARETGISHLLALMSPFFVRWLNSIGLSCRKAGPTTKLPDGKRVCVIEMPLVEDAHSTTKGDFLTL